MGVFGAYTRWAVVFLIIFVLFFLLCPTGYGAVGAGGTNIAVTSYEGTIYPMGTLGMGGMGGLSGYGGEYSSSSM